MKTVLIFALLFGIASAAGRTAFSRSGVLRASPWERWVYSSALGLGAAAYGVLFLGLLGLLEFWPITGWWGVLALVGLPGARAYAEDLRRAVVERKQAALQPGWRRILGSSALCILLVLGVLGIVLCFRPPGGHEWDALAYHLADPKVFLMDHRITSLPTEHHSNFPFTIELLFTVGLLYDGYALANLFHFGMAVLTVALLISFGTRMFSSSAGRLAGLLFASTPLAFWEATSAYIDVGSGLFTTLSLCAGLSGIAELDPKVRRQWIALAGIAMGFALGTKYLALLPFGLLAGLLLVRRLPLREVAVYAALALVIGSPWYLKNLTWTHNPVYPFFYRIFPQSRYWSPDRAAAYQSEQDSFGFPHALSKPGDSLRNLVEAPWRILTHGEKYANLGDYTISVTCGGLFAAFAFGSLFVRKRSATARDLLLLGVVQLLAWFVLAQIGRYLVSLVPIFALIGGYVASQWLEDNEAPALRSTGNGFRQLLGSCSVLGILGQVALLLWSLFLDPTSGREALEKGVLPSSESVPQTVQQIAQGTLMSTLNHTLDIYPASQWINANTPLSARVILFEETRGFYLDRSYLWGNTQHSSFIPYESFHSGKDLNDWFQRQHYQYALINLKFSPQSGTDSTLPSGPVGNEAEAVQRWYGNVAPSAEHWRYLVSDAIRTCGWSFQFGQNGVAVIALGEPQSSRRLSEPFHQTYAGSSATRVITHSPMREGGHG